MGSVSLPDICNSVSAGVAILDKNYVIQDVNDEVVRKGGFPREAVIGHSFLEFVHKEDVERVREMLDKAMRESTARVTVRVVGNQTYYWIYLRLTKFEDYIVASMIDVNGMVISHNALHERNEELQTIYRFVNAISSTLDIERIYEIAYEEFSGIFDYLDAFSIGIIDRAKSVIHIEFVVGDGQRYDKHDIAFDDRETLTGWVAVHGKMLYIHDIEKDELPAGFKLVGVPMRAWLGIPLEYRGEVLGVLTVQSKKPDIFTGRDIRILKLISTNLAMVLSNASLYSALKEREERYRTLVTMSLVGLVIMDANNRISFVNDAMANMVGYSVDEILGKDPLEFTTEKGARAMLVGRDRRKQGYIDTYEAELVRKDGTVIPVLIYAAPVKDEHGNVVETMTAVVDISPLKKLEKELRESKQLQELLLHIASHDIKTPLGVILGYTELLREDCNEEYLDEIESAVDNALTLVNNIRVLSQIDMGRINEVKERFSVREMVDECVELVKKKYPDVDIVVKDDDTDIEGYSTLMREAVLNLLVNACKYGATKVEIRISVTDEQVEIDIADDGPGIPDEKKESIFDPFVKYGRGGSGLGLSIVQRVVSLHGGTIHIRDNEPHGSVFVITLPLKT